MKILGISGSPNKDGNTAYAVNYALNIIKKEGFETKYISLAGKKINPCIACWKCEETQECCQDDDMKEIIDAMRWCNGIIIGSPVYFGLVAGQLKTMMDRTIVLRPSYNSKIEMWGKTGGGIACAASRSGGQEVTLQNIHTFLMQHGMKVVNDGPPFSHSGGTIMKEAKDDNWGLETVRNLAINIANILRR
jgi:multimeric flavodoxin WrbA